MRSNEDTRAKLRYSLLRRLEWLRRIRTSTETQQHQVALTALRAWQAARLEHSFQDLLADPGMRPACRFFLEDLYSERDFSQRDREMERILPTMAQILPGRLLHAAIDAVELHALSLAFDRRLAQAMLRRRWPRLDDERYGVIYREAGLPRLRRHQIRLIVRVGGHLDHAVQQFGVGRILQASRLPAKLAGLGALQSFLERGFNAFAILGGAQRFLARIEEGELEVCRRLFAADPDPFGRGSPR